MKKTAKKIGLCALSSAVFLAYFAISLSCASSKKAITVGEEISVNFNQESENSWKDYDIFVVSEEPSPSRILKVVPKKDSKNAEDSEELNTFFVISNPGDNEVVKKVNSDGGVSKKEKIDPKLVTSSELVGKIFISEDDAKQAVEFINQIEQNYNANRSGDGVLNKFEVKKVWTETKTETVWEKTGETVLSNGMTFSNGKQVVNEREISKSERLFFIQHSTAFGKDEILYSAGFTVQNLGYGKTITNPFPPVVVKLEEILAIRDALAK